MTERILSEPKFSPFLFWDSDLEKIDFELDAPYFIRRVFDMGRLEDVAEAMRIYSDQRLISTLTAATYLPENAIALASALFDLKSSDFKCYSSKQFHRSPEIMAILSHSIMVQILIPI